MSRVLDEVSARHHVPPPLLKAIAWRESGWQQFRNGTTKLSTSCAVGLMQVLGRTWDQRRLASDYRYNADVGARILAAKMNDSSRNVPPSLGRDEPRILENWYRAAFRYLGSGSAAESYADDVYDLIATPPSGIAPYTPAVPVRSPKDVLRGYRPNAGHAYVARLDGTWVSTIGRAVHGVTRADLLAARVTLTRGSTLESGQRVTAALTARNVGWLTWSAGQIALRTVPIGSASRLADPSWASASHPTNLNTSVPTGALARFTFTGRAPQVSQETRVRGTFVPALGGTPIGQAATADWTVVPAAAPSVAITSAPTYVPDVATDSKATIGLAASDPMPGSGLRYIEVATRVACDSCTWTVAGRVRATSIRVPLGVVGRHEVRARAVDHAGNWSAWTPSSFIIVPRDNRNYELGFSDRWVAHDVGESWLGSVAIAPVGATVETQFTGSSFALIGAKGPDVAPIAVYVDGLLVGVTDPASDRLQQRQVLIEGQVAPATHLLRLVVGEPGPPLLAEEDRRMAWLDAVALV